MIGKLTHKVLLVSLLMIFLFSCTKESCFNCNTYNMFKLTGNLNDSTGTFNICENDNMWEEIVWAEYSSNNGGELTLIDLDEYTLGYRIIDNDDIDNDGIINNQDSDIDNDGIINNEDLTPYGTEDNSVIELIICTNN